MIKHRFHRLRRCRETEIVMMFMASILLIALSGCQAGESNPPGDLETPPDHTATPGSSKPAITVPMPSEEVAVPPPAAAARQALADQLGIPIEQIHFVEITRVDWPDSCLGVYQPDVMCAQAIVPGTKVVLEANGQQYEYHTDLTGSRVILADSPDMSGERPVIEWAWIHDGACDAASIGEQTVVYGACAGAQQAGEFASTVRMDELLEFSLRYAPFEAETPAGKVLFNGRGDLVATPVEQRMIAEWSRLVFQEAQAGRSGAAWGLALAWNRKGGIAGFCDDLVIYVTGEALASSCKPGDNDNYASINNASIRLEPQEMEMVYDWLDSYQSLELKQNDPPAMDAMNIYLIFSGNGIESAPPEVQQAMLDLATQVFERAQNETR